MRLHFKFLYGVGVLVLGMAVIVCFGLSSWAGAQQIPRSSLEKLQDILAMVRDRLWEVDDIFWHRGEYARCVAVLQLIYAIDPSDTEAYANAAWLVENALMEPADKAEKILLQGLERNKYVYDLYWELGFFYYIHARFDEAIDCLEKAVAFEVPVYVWHFLAHSYEHAGDVGTAIAIWFQQEALEPDSPVPGIQIERILRGGEAIIPPQMLRHMRERESAGSETGISTDR
ncbi:MAG: tetratricopeptide repeat protein [Armatimonadota bacterium]